MARDEDREDKEEKREGKGTQKGRCVGFPSSRSNMELGEAEAVRHFLTPANDRWEDQKHQGE